MKLTLRPGKPADAESCAAICYQAFKSIAQAHNFPPDIPSPALAADSVYFGTFDNVVLAFNLKTRKQLWQYENKERPFPFYSSAAIAGGKIILGGRDKFIHCLDAKTGKELWTVQTRSRALRAMGENIGRLHTGLPLLNEVSLDNLAAMAG